MVGQALGILELAFSQCAEWTGGLLGAVNGSGIVLAAFSLVLVVSLLFMPLRGSGMSAISDYVRNPIHKRKKKGD